MEGLDALYHGLSWKSNSPPPRLTGKGLFGIIPIFILKILFLTARIELFLLPEGFSIPFRHPPPFNLKRGNLTEADMRRHSREMKDIWVDIEVRYA